MSANLCIGRKMATIHLFFFSQVRLRAYQHHCMYLTTFLHLALMPKYPYSNTSTVSCTVQSHEQHLLWLNKVYDITQLDKMVITDTVQGIIPTILISGFGAGLGTQVCGFKPSRSRRIFFRGKKKFLSTPSFRGEVKPSVPCRRFAACKSSLNVMWKSTVAVPPFATRGSLRLRGQGGRTGGESGNV